MHQSYLPWLLATASNFQKRNLNWYVLGNNNYLVSLNNIFVDFLLIDTEGDQIKWNLFLFSLFLFNVGNKNIN